MPPAPYRQLHLITSFSKRFWITTPLESGVYVSTLNFVPTIFWFWLFSTSSGVGLDARLSHHFP